LACSFLRFSLLLGLARIQWPLRRMDFPPFFSSVFLVMGLNSSLTVRISIVPPVLQRKLMIPPPLPPLFDGAIREAQICHPQLHSSTDHRTLFFSFPSLREEIGHVGRLLANSSQKYPPSAQMIATHFKNHPSVAMDNHEAPFLPLFPFLLTTRQGRR